MKPSNRGRQQSVNLHQNKPSGSLDAVLNSGKSNQSKCKPDMEPWELSNDSNSFH